LKVLSQATVTVDNNSTPVTGTVQPNWNDGAIQVYELGGAITLDFSISNAKAGASYMLVIVQPVSSSHTVTWPSSVMWANGIDPVMSIAGASIRTDVYTLVYLGTTQAGSGKYIGTATQNMF
jgi:hypothetical protein